MFPSKKSPRRRKGFEIGAEALESRSLLTGGAGNMFAVIPGTVPTPGGTVSVSFTIDPAHFTLPRHSLALGIDIVAPSGSTLKPFIKSVTDPHGGLIPQTFHSIYDPHLTHPQVANGAGTNAVITPIKLYPHDSQRPVTYTVQVDGESNSSGNFLLGFYLPGDANGDGHVDATDIQIVKSELNSRDGDARYTMSADANRDRRIGKIDLAYTLQNQGVSTDILPTVTTNLDPASDTGIQGDRITASKTVHFTGIVSPDATITYTNNNATASAVKTTTTADSMGNYSLIAPLGAGNLGSNTFTVSSTDSFGQTITGPIAAISYNPNAPALKKTT